MAFAAEIAGCLAATLDSNPNTRITAELKLAEYFTKPESGLALSQLILAQDVDLALRQHSAIIVLRKYVRERWSPYFSTFRGSPPPVEVKTQIRQSVFQGLSDPDRKIRSLCAHTLSSIANCDWPDEYPDLLSSLINLLSSGSPSSVHGAMQVFTEFIKSDLTEDQILPVLRQLLPVLLNILGSTESHSAPTRARTVSVFRQCVTALFMVKDQHPQAVQEVTATVLPVWLDAFKVLLNLDLQREVGGDNWDGLAIRIQVFKVLDTIHTSFPRTLTPYLPDYLASSLHHLQILYPPFVHYFISSSDSAPHTSEDESIELPQLIVPIFDFVSAVVRGGKAKSWFQGDRFATLISAVFKFAQMTEEDEETWASNPNAFIAQEDDETQAYGVRVSGFDLLGNFFDRNPVQTSRFFQNAIEQIIHDSEADRKAGSQSWWRPLEAALASIGSQAEAILDCIDDETGSSREKPIDIESLLVKVIPSLLGLSEYPFLQGQGFVFASRFSRLLPAQTAVQYLEAAIQVIENPDGKVPLKISAVKAVHNFCEEGEDSILSPYAVRMAKDLGPFLLATSEDTLLLVLETISSLVTIDEAKWLDAELTNSLVVAILEVWNRNNKDPLFIAVLADVLTSLASSPTHGVNETVVKQALPVLTTAMTSAKPEESWITSSAIDLIDSIAQGSTNRLAEGFFAHIAPGLFKCMGETEDRDVLQNGIKCLTVIIRTDHNQVVAWHDDSGRSGLDYVLMVIAKALENQDESAGLVLGDLIIHLLRKVGETVLPVLPQLLQSMVNRMATAKTATFIQSLVIPFAFLVNSQRDIVVSLLESTQIQDRTALDILINTWCENAETFQGFWSSRISTLGLSQLFVAERPSLQGLKVKGDIIAKPETQNGETVSSYFRLLHTPLLFYVTESDTNGAYSHHDKITHKEEYAILVSLDASALFSRCSSPALLCHVIRLAPHEFASVPFPVKALKLLVREIQSGGDSATITARAGDTVDVESDDGDEEWTEEEKLNQGFKVDEFAFLSDMIGPKGVKFDDDDVPNALNDIDAEFADDPVYQMDMQSHLASFIKECAARNTSHFASVVDQLSAEEMLVIRGVVQG